MEYYWAIEKQGLLADATTWINLQPWSQVKDDCQEEHNRVSFHIYRILENTNRSLLGGWEGQAGEGWEEGKGKIAQGDKEASGGGWYFQFCISKYVWSMIRQLHLNLSFLFCISKYVYVNYTQI